MRGELSKMNLDAYRRQYVSVIFPGVSPVSTAHGAGKCVLSAGALRDSRKGGQGTGAEEFGASGNWGREAPPVPLFSSPAANSSGWAIARALSSGAKILLADEPTGNLDGENSRNIVEILMRLAHEAGYCVVIVTHDPAIADAADVVYTVADGVLTG